MILTENSMRYYSDSEIDLLIDEISKAANEAIEQAAGEAARAAFMASLEREAAAYREAHRWRLEAQRAKNTGRKNALLAGAICFVGGLVLGISGSLILGGR